MILKTRSRVITFPRRPLILGIVNINDDSFSGDGSLDIGEALVLARQHIGHGADIIDVGGESARTNRPAISERAEIERVLPFVEQFPQCYCDIDPIDPDQLFPPLLSINTWRPGVAHTLISVGGDILNDMSGLNFSENARAAAEFGAALVLMHLIGKPKERHIEVQYADVIRTLQDFFSAGLEQAMQVGLSREAMMLDPGIDFAKQRADNLRVLRHLSVFTEFDRPVLLSISRKTVIGEVLGLPEPADRDAGTIACVVAGLHRGASLFRVHNVAAVAQAIRVLWPVVRTS
jgi:dihydropteroate synthase